MVSMLALLRGVLAIEKLEVEGCCVPVFLYVISSRGWHKLIVDIAAVSKAHFRAANRVLLRLCRQ